MRIKIKVDGVSSISPENPSRVDPKWQLLQTWNCYVINLPALSLYEGGTDR